VHAAACRAASADTSAAAGAQLVKPIAECGSRRVLAFVQLAVYSWSREQSVQRGNTNHEACLYLDAFFIRIEHHTVITSAMGPNIRPCLDARPGANAGAAADN
jgi:hypothetical protein